MNLEIILFKNSGRWWRRFGETYTADNASAVDVLLSKIDASGEVLWKWSIDSDKGGEEHG